MKKVAVAALAFALIMMLATVVPALAKNYNDLPEGAVRNYWAGGSGRVETPLNWPPGGNHPETLRVYAQHVEEGTLGTADIVVIFIPYAPPFNILPVACFSTNGPDAFFERKLRSGTPASLANNTRLVPESSLAVERHGNRITVALNAPQTIRWLKAGGGGYVDVVIPAFEMELNQDGGSLHWDTEVPLVGFPNSSNYTVVDNNMGFDANGVFTCSAWSYTARPMTDCSIVMHGINTNLPP